MIYAPRTSASSVSYHVDRVVSTLAYFYRATYLVRRVLLREEARNVRRDEAGSTCYKDRFSHIYCYALIPGTAVAM